MHVTFLPITHRFLGDAFFKRPVVSPGDVGRADSGLRKLLSSPREAARGGSASAGDKRRRPPPPSLHEPRDQFAISRPHASRAGTRSSPSPANLAPVNNDRRKLPGARRKIPRRARTLSETDDAAALAAIGSTGDLRWAPSRRSFLCVSRLFRCAQITEARTGRRGGRKPAPAVLLRFLVSALFGFRATLQYTR